MRTLIVCANTEASRTLTDRLRSLGHTVCATATGGPQAVDEAAESQPDLAVVDLDDGAGAVGAAERLRARLDLPLVYLVGDADDPLLDRARATDPLGYVLKPFDDRQLRLSMEAALATHARASEKQRQAASASTREVTRLQARCDLLGRAFDLTTEGVAVVDRGGGFVLVNRALGDIFGADPSATDPDRWSDVYEAFQPDERTPLPSSDYALGHALSSDQPIVTEIFVRRRGRSDGVHLAVHGRPLHDADGRVQGAAVAVRDISRQKAAEVERHRTLESLREQADLMERVFNGMSEGIAVFDSSGRYLMLNERGRRIVGGPPDREVDRLYTRYDFRHADDLSPCPPEDLPTPRVLRGESFDDLELCLIKPAPNADIYISVSGRPLLDRDGATVRGGVTIFRNVTRERQKEHELRDLARSLEEQKQAMEIVFDCMSDGVIAADEHGKFTIFNRSARRIVGMGAIDTTPDQWGSRYGLFLPDGVTPAPQSGLPLSRALRGESSNDVEMFVRNERLPGGAYVSVNGRPLTDARGNLKGGVVVFRDVTRLRETERQLQMAADRMKQQNEFMEMVFDGISDGVVAADADGKLTLANRSAERMVGMGLTDADSSEWSGIYGTFFRDGVTPVPEEALPLVRAMRGRTSDGVDLFIRNPHVPRGVHVSVSGRPMRDASGTLTGGVIVMRDTTPRVEAQAALQQAFTEGRLEIIDTVLHNIGNAINSVAIGVETICEQTGDSELLCRFKVLADLVAAHEDDWLEWLSTDPQGRDVRGFLLALVQDLAAQSDLLKRTSDRVANRVRHIVDIIRTQESFADSTVELTPVNLREAIADAVMVLQESLSRRDIRVEIDCERAPDAVPLQEGKFHQMLINLLKNAVEAIDEAVRGGGGPAEPRVRVAAYVDEAHLALDVTDNGIGIESQALAEVFTADYSTKERGSGLGLHSVANYVIAAGGSVRALSPGAGGGATLRVRLRLAGAGARAPDQEGAGVRRAPERIRRRTAARAPDRERA